MGYWVRQHCKSFRFAAVHDVISYCQAPCTACAQTADADQQKPRIKKTKSCAKIIHRVNITELPLTFNIIKTKTSPWASNEQVIR